MKSSRLAILLFSLASSVATVSHAQSSGQASESDTNDRPPNCRPPQAAFDACQGKAAGDSCSVTFHEHTMTGTCASTPEAQLACRPDHPPPGAPPAGGTP